MYTLRDEGNTRYELSEEEYSWMVGQLKAKRISALKKDMIKYMEQYGVAELRTLVKEITKQ